MIFLCGVLQKTLRAGAQNKSEDACRMGTLIFWGVIVLGLFLGIVLISLLNMAQRSERIYDRMLRGEEIARPANPLYRPATEILKQTSSGESRPQRDLSASVAAP